MSTRIPIFKDDLSFEDRQSKVWEDMTRDMDRRRREWENEIENVRKGFFSLKPNGKFDNIASRLGDVDFGVGSSIASGIKPGVCGDFDDATGIIEKDANGRPVFKVRFDVRDFKPEEVNVKMDVDKMQVHAKHESKTGGSSVSREYSRSVNIPKDIDPMNLQCTMSNDGILSIEAPLPLPEYAALNDSPSRGSIGSAMSPPPNSAAHSTSINNSATRPVIEEKKYKDEIDIEDYNPEEITVKTLDKKLVITARREEKIGNRTTTKNMSKESTIPDNVDPLSVKAFFAENGRLLIEAVYKSDPRCGSPLTRTDTHHT
ncbi:major egg antigen [Octopus bimaculoides]|uniref:SHSP domain-containing protein n=1 Tax=Octopus bimaculoides TaxID=37653 RepID=A0A0L8IB26_OCTBM|nr:major egg antigen [Octopus bimaculoides]XP_014780643.1 major egg antigen [Octopus bimaculoides]XP_014780649.1 major egg antigen [Octopus bimaculoides]XP_014780658.1 major egg antigen [Octopus bimaculoides]XP_014780666.1 major egg antigen [Octopus bimaculoides]XP_014780682.1 major egg antigen [Octopus bimaculoides]XP_014780690.1 major egg antigen [Octopus bimaculoides]XP_052823775.1 major egg antigen [Octopus bimaculoides]XP_052823776.1 major egg antigen [Octopus bimaculoides]|eukprot:XP_014780635.1 PREDICTED: major egg antigen-like [Octopus bimaculoides]